MSIIGSNVLAGASGSGVEAYEIERSLRFHNADSSNLSKTFSSAGNRKKWTWSGWVKRSALGGTEGIFAAGTGASDYTSLYFQSDVIKLEDYTGAGTVSTTEVFKDPGAFFHLIVAVDTTLTTDADRVKFYINGSAATTSGTWAQDTQTRINNNVAHRIGALYGHTAGNGLNGYLADCIFVDGSALSPSDLGEDDSDGVWQPKEYSGTYGTNGFHLDFSDNSSNAALGTDSSGNSNTWTVNNLSVASGAGNDSLIDTPTNYEADSGNNGGNYATLNPLAPRDIYITYAQGNLQITSATYYRSAISTIRLNDGKYYIEAECTTISDNGYNFVGAITDTNDINYPSHANDNGFGYYSGDGGVYVSQASQATYSTWTTGDVIGFAYDSATGKCWVAKNGVWQNSGNPAAGTGEVHTISTYATKDVFYCVAAGTNGVMNVNFGQRPFAYTPPTGYVSLCTQNLTDITVTTSGSYTGNSDANGPFVFLNGVPTAMTIGGSAVTFGTGIDKLSNGFKIRSAITNNTSGTSYSYSVTTAGDPFKTARAQSN